MLRNWLPFVRGVTLLCVIVFLSILIPVMPRAWSATAGAAENRLRIALFRADITPPLGVPLGIGFYNPAKEIVDPLSARGIVILSDKPPVVLCAVDLILLNNGGYDAFREALAKAAGTTPDRVTLNCLHQHDAPGFDFTAEELLAPVGLGGKMFDVAYARTAIARTAEALTQALAKPQAVTQLGVGQAQVEQVASNRRIIGPDGKSKAVRWSATTDPLVRAEPEGLIDPFVKLLSFWDGERPLAAMTFYATHPQSYYGKGEVSCDFPGLARGLRERELPDLPHIHFNGAGGNVTAGKYNDGDPANRPVLAERLAAGMRRAWEATKKFPITAADLEYRVTAVALPLSPQVDIAKLRAQLANETAAVKERTMAAFQLAWSIRCAAGHKLDLTALRLGPAWVLQLPGELFIEYQLAAQKLRPDDFVCVAAYADGGPGYIGTSIAYEEGGYEPSASRVAPTVEKVLTNGIRELLK